VKSTTKIANKVEHHGKANPQNGQGLQDHLSQLKHPQVTTPQRVERKERAQRDVVEKHKREARSLLTLRKRKPRLVDRKSS